MLYRIFLVKESIVFFIYFLGTVDYLVNKIHSDIHNHRNISFTTYPPPNPPLTQLIQVYKGKKLSVRGLPWRINLYTFLQFLLRTPEKTLGFGQVHILLDNDRLAYMYIYLCIYNCVVFQPKIRRITQKGLKICDTILSEFFRHKASKLNFRWVKAFTCKTANFPPDWAKNSAKSLKLTTLQHLSLYWLVGWPNS